jgi:hypothetical protein
LSSSFLEAVFREASQRHLDTETSVCFILDEELRIVYCNPAWDSFAVENGAPSLCAQNMVGRLVLDSTTGIVTAYYRSLYAAVLRDGRCRSHEFHCSSPDLQRLFRMDVFSLKAARALLVSCSIRLEQPHSDISREPTEARYRNVDGLIVMCSNCRKTRRAEAAADVWDWVPQFTAHPPGMVSHGLCNLCLEHYFPASD